MKRRDIIGKLEAAGFRMQEGGNHTKVFKGKRYITTVPRHRDVNQLTARAVAKQTGVKLD